MGDARKGTIYALVAVLLFATLGTGFKLSVSRLDSFTVTVVMGAVATVALFLNLLVKGKARLVTEEFRRMPRFFVAAGIIGLGVQQILCLRAYELLPAFQAVILTYTYPLMMVVLARLVYRERTTPLSVFCVLLGFGGVYLLLSEGRFMALDLSPGVAVALLTALAFALFCVMIKHGRFDVEVGMFLFNLFGLFFLLCLAPFFGFDPAIDPGQLLVLIYLGVFPTAVAFILWNRALHLTRTGRCSNIALLTPLLSLLIISLVLGERITLHHLAGLLIIVVSVFININFGES
ncbi:MAG: DMT family transporter [Desulfuromonadales bacterium]|nr:MAG: DMT family transporter [Desulfuromonadales bacterium]